MNNDLNVDTVAAEIERGHCPLLRIIMIQSAEARRRIILEELCQLVRAFLPVGEEHSRFSERPMFSPRDLDEATKPRDAEIKRLKALVGEEPVSDKLEWTFVEYSPSGGKVVVVLTEGQADKIKQFLKGKEKL